MLLREELLLERLTDDMSVGGRRKGRGGRNPSCEGVELLVQGKKKGAKQGGRLVSLLCISLASLRIARHSQALKCRPRRWIQRERGRRPAHVDRVLASRPRLLMYHQRTLNAFSIPVHASRTPTAPSNPAPSALTTNLPAPLAFWGVVEAAAAVSIAVLNTVTGANSVGEEGVAEVLVSESREVGRPRPGWASFQLLVETDVEVVVVDDVALVVEDVLVVEVVLVDSSIVEACRRRVSVALGEGLNSVDSRKSTRQSRYWPLLTW